MAFQCASGGKLQANFETFERKGGFLVFLIDKHLINWVSKERKTINPFYHVTSFLIHFDSSRLICMKLEKDQKYLVLEILLEGRDLKSDRHPFQFLLCHLLPSVFIYEAR